MGCGANLPKSDGFREVYQSRWAAGALPIEHRGLGLRESEAFGFHEVSEGAPAVGVAHADGERAIFASAVQTCTVPVLWLEAGNQMIRLPGVEGPNDCKAAQAPNWAARHEA